MDSTARRSWELKSSLPAKAGFPSQNPVSSWNLPKLPVSFLGSVCLSTCLSSFLFHLLRCSYIWRMEGASLSFTDPALWSLFYQTGQGDVVEQESGILSFQHAAHLELWCVVSGLDPRTDITGSTGEMLCSGVTDTGVLPSAVPWMLPCSHQGLAVA